MYRSWMWPDGVACCVGNVLRSRCGRSIGDGVTDDGWYLIGKGEGVAKRCRIRCRCMVLSDHGCDRGSVAEGVIGWVSARVWPWGGRSRMLEGVGRVACNAVGVLWSGFFGVMNFRRPQPNFANAIRWRKKIPFHALWGLRWYIFFSALTDGVCVCVFVLCCVCV